MDLFLEFRLVRTVNGGVRSESSPVEIYPKIIPPAPGKPNSCHHHMKLKKATCMQKNRLAHSEMQQHRVQCPICPKEGDCSLVCRGKMRTVVVHLIKLVITYYRKIFKLWKEWNPDVRSELRTPCRLSDEMLEGHCRTKRKQN